MSDEWRHDHGEWNGAHPLATTDRYMDSHPEVAQQLEKDPRWWTIAHTWTAIRACMNTCTIIR